MTSLAAANRRSSRTEAAGSLAGLYERHARMVYGVCRAMLRNVHEAEDATQQVFLSAHKAILGGAVVRDPAGWLATIARNECRARIAEGMRRPVPVADEDLHLIPSSGDELLRRSQLEELRGALAQLPERQREAVVLRYFYGLRYGEVAAALGLSRPATEALLFRARRALRVRLRPVVGAALVVPSVIRDELALALPGFGGGGAGAGAATAGVAGGLIAKLTAAPVGAKIATAAVAVSAVGAVGTVPSERIARADAQPPAVGAMSGGGAEQVRPMRLETVARPPTALPRPADDSSDSRSAAGPGPDRGTGGHHSDPSHSGSSHFGSGRSGVSGAADDGTSRSGPGSGASTTSVTDNPDVSSPETSSGPSGSTHPREADVLTRESNSGPGSADLGSSGPGGSGGDSSLPGSESSGSGGSGSGSSGADD